MILDIVDFTQNQLHHCIFLLASNRGHRVEKFELDFDPEHTTPARVFRASLPWRAMGVCSPQDRNLARIFLPRGPYCSKNARKYLKECCTIGVKHYIIFALQMKIQHDPSFTSSFLQHDFFPKMCYDRNSINVNKRQLGNSTVHIRKSIQKQVYHHRIVLCLLFIPRLRMYASLDPPFGLLL